MFKKTLSLTIVVCFFLTTLGPYPQAHADSVLGLPTPGTMVSVSPSFEPALIKGLTVHKDNPFLFDFIVDPGQSKVSKEVLKDESMRMIKYFFAALTIPDKDIWVNLSPYEKDRMIPVSLGRTAMGRDLLAQDYMLKQLTASLLYPQKALGKIFWDKVYSKAKAMYGTTEIPVNTFNKVWIVPQKAGVYEHGQTAFIVSGHLKVMLEEDYLALKKNTVILSEAKDLNKINSLRDSSATPQNDVNALGSQVIRQIILPEIEKEINEGKNFATLRQIFYAQVLAVWFKRNLKQALLNRVYANKGTVKGIDQNDSATNETIYHQYLRAYKKGVFNFIKEDTDPATQETLPRKYFSGGFGDLAQLSIVPEQLSDAAMAEVAKKDVDFAVLAAQPKDAAMINRREAVIGLARLATGIAVLGVAGGLPALAARPKPASEDHIIFLLNKLGDIAIPDAEKRPEFKEILGMGHNAYLVLVNIVIYHNGPPASLPLAAYLAEILAPSKKEADAFRENANDPSNPKIGRAAEQGLKDRDRKSWPGRLNRLNRDHRLTIGRPKAKPDAAMVAADNEELAKRIKMQGDQVIVGGTLFNKSTFWYLLDAMQNDLNNEKKKVDGRFSHHGFVLLGWSHDTESPKYVLLKSMGGINNLVFTTKESKSLALHAEMEIGLKENGVEEVRDETFERIQEVLTAIKEIVDSTMTGKDAAMTVRSLKMIAISSIIISNALILPVAISHYRNGDVAGALVWLVAALSTGLPWYPQMRRLNKMQEKEKLQSSHLPKEGGDKASLAINPNGGIDLSQQDAALHVEKDANGGVKVNVDPALIARVEREGMPEVVPVIINMQPADIRSLFGVEASI